MNSQLYALFAAALCYPGPDMIGRVKELEAELAKLDVSYSIVIQEFRNYVEATSPENLEEAYTNTFDIQAVCPLEVGYTLFGEDYKRGEFLVRMSDLHQNFQTDLIKFELADYLPNVLLVLSKMPEDGLKKDFIEKILLPSLVKMLKNFDEKTGVNPFSRPIRVMNDILLSSHTMNPTILEARYE